jgi:hypothetical protein
MSLFCASPIDIGISTFHSPKNGSVIGENDLFLLQKNAIFDTIVLGEFTNDIGNRFVQRKGTCLLRSVSTTIISK